MAQFVRHLPCDACGSKDNLGVYSDGSRWCFGCHTYYPATAEGRIKELLNEKDKANFRNMNPSLPPDFTTHIPPVAANWLAEYGITTQDRVDHMIGWSPDYERLVFPVRNEKNQVIFWTGRYFGKDPSKSKYFTVGNRNEVLHILNKESVKTTIILVEDMVSAIKIAKCGLGIPVMPLFGSNIPVEHARKLSDRFWEVRIWLDPDMRRTSLKESLRLSPWFRSVSCIFSKTDPKECTESEIVEYLK